MTNSQTASVDSDVKTETRDCLTHGEYEAELFLIVDKWFGGNCPKCVEESDKKRAEEEKQRQIERDRMRIERALRHSCVPERFRDRTLDRYRADSPGQKKALQVATKAASKDVAKGLSLIFCGKPGTGKTHLACGIALEWIATERQALFATVLAAIRHIKSTYNRNSEITEDEAISAFTQVDLLVLDEIGVQLGTEHEKMLLFEIINERYQEMKSTILISNLTRSELTEYLGDRVMDRFRETGAVVAFDWESYRGSK